MKETHHWRGFASLRNHWRKIVVAVLLSCGMGGDSVFAQTIQSQKGINLALVAKASTSFVSGHESLAAVNDGFDPAHSDDKSHRAYGNWPKSGTQWVQYEWSQPISTSGVDLYWFDDDRGVRLPKTVRLKYWDGSNFVPVPNPSALQPVKNKLNPLTFDEITTAKLRLELDSNGTFSTGLLEWKVYDSGKSPNFAPSVAAGMDRVVVIPGKTHLQGTVKDDGKSRPSPKITWSKASGPGTVTFDNAEALTTTAAFATEGTYELRLIADDGELKASSTVQVTAVPPPPAKHLDPVPTLAYQINNPLWNHRLKKTIVNWIPHCYNKISDPKLPEGGIVNFVEAGKKNAGQAHGGHIGPVFANAWVHNTVEAMCVALMLDPQGDEEIRQAQAAIRAKLEDWIPKLISAQEPDGYLQTCYTLNGHRRWTNKGDHEGYLAGYFIEAAIAHYLMTGQKDGRMYEAAKKLADCWCNNIGPAPKKYWYEGHQELEQALVRLARFVNDVEGGNRGQKYIDLAKFLLDSRRDGEEYDQSHAPVIHQYEAVGHAVRAAYSYSAMTDIAMETGDLDYHSAVKSIWANIVHKKYYVTGGIGSGETSEGFGNDYSLPNNAYCESCADCGELFFQHKMNLVYQESLYADLCEETLYNAILGSLDLEGKNFTYTNPLDSGGARYGWHGCPCCVGNIPRTLLMLPTWMYAKSADGLYVNLFIGSSVQVPGVAGTDLQVIQETDYPWSGKVAMKINPAETKEFSVRIRVPNRNVSELYTSSPVVNGLVSLAVNGVSTTPRIENGYVLLRRTWKRGDIIEITLPMQVQQVRSRSEVAANAGRVALRYGPLIYNVESVDQDLGSTFNPATQLHTEWNPTLLGGVLVIKGAFTSGTILTAIPNYIRLNRGGRSLVWIKEK